MDKIRKYVVVVLLSLSIISCKAKTLISEYNFKEGDTTIISEQVDLRGSVLILPKNVTLKFEKKGGFKNGYIVGDNTSIGGYKQAIFDDITISGQWNIEYINTSMFKDLRSVNALKNVFALTSDKVSNVVTIDIGNYLVAANFENQTVLKVPSNTEIILNGIITLEPNDLTNYYIIELQGENIKLHGRGEIVGDKHTHIGIKGEWGMGVMLSECLNVDIYDLTIKDCWGDCIYIGDNSSDVYINNCILDHGRRQGISITSAKDVLIENCVITNVGGTSPEYAIDIEPNKDEAIDNVVINNVKCLNCRGGFLSWGGAENCSIKNVAFYNCYVEGASKVEYSFNTSESIKLVNCLSDRGTAPLNNKCKFFIIENR